MTFKEDAAWSGMLGAGNFEEFKTKIVPPFLLKSEVPDGVKEDVAVIHKLIIHSYYEYEFIDIALVQAIFTLEKAMKIRYLEITGNPAKMRFEKLIDWFSINNYFEATNKDLVHQLRSIRNGKVHDEKKTLGGIIFLMKIEAPIRLINDLYEDVALRIQRHSERDLWNNKLKGFAEDGCIALIDDKRLLVHKVFVVFVDNKSKPNVLSVVVWPIFDPQPYDEGHNYTPPSHLIEITDVNITEDTLTGKTLEGKDFSCVPIKDEINRGKFDFWKNWLKNYSENWTINSSMQLTWNTYFNTVWGSFHHRINPNFEPQETND